MAVAVEMLGVMVLVVVVCLELWVGQGRWVLLGHAVGCLVVGGRDVAGRRLGGVAVPVVGRWMVGVDGGAAPGVRGVLELLWIRVSFLCF